MKRLGKSFKASIKSIDAFGIEVGLTYKGEKEIKSLAGGIPTIFAKILTLAYFAF